MHLLLLTVATALLSALLTGLVRNYSLSREVLDIPNERSSHTVPTPRGGGLAIVAAALIAIGVALALGWVASRTALAIIPGGLLVAAIGWMDDHRPLSAAQRLAAHVAAAAWGVFVLGGLPVLQLGTVSLPVGIGGSVFAVVTIVWVTNLYNFMDGIDGIAATEAVTVALGGAVLALLGGAAGVAVMALVIAAATIGFIGWNWQPAHIFMGDVGSGFLGYSFAVIAVVSEKAGGPSMLLWGLVLGVFVFDATLTLLRRAVRGERLLAAHRTHAYQRAVQSGMSHAQVTSATALLNLVLVGLAAVAYLQPSRTVVVLIAGCGLLIGVYLWVERRQRMLTSLSAVSEIR